MALHLTLTDSEKKQLLSLSRNALKFCFENPAFRDHHFITDRPYSKCKKELMTRYSDMDIPILREMLTCFVTLYTIEGRKRNLRGCIGTIEARSGETLLEDLIGNTLMAAFGDSRFEPLQATELGATLIEISILSSPRPVTFATREELFGLIRGKGVLMQSGIYRSTFLPQVWDQISEPEAFLMHLARKAGMQSRDYLSASYEIYEVCAFEEENSES